MSSPLHPLPTKLTPSSPSLPLSDSLPFPLPTSLPTSLPAPSSLLLLLLLAPLLCLLATFPHFPLHKPLEALAHYHDALPRPYRPWTELFARPQRGSAWVPSHATRGLRAVFQRRRRGEAAGASAPAAPTAVVTGADGGVGFETTLALLRAGATVFMGILPDGGSSSSSSSSAPRAVVSVHSMREPLPSVGPLLGGAHVGDRIVEMRRRQEARRGRVDLTLEAMEARLGAEGGGVSEERGRAIPFACDLTTFDSTRASALALQQAMAQEEERVRRLKTGKSTTADGTPPARSAAAAAAWPHIDYFVGTVGVGHDMPGPKGVLSGRYTENADGLEYQLGINAVNSVLFLMLLAPALVRGEEQNGDGDGDGEREEGCGEEGARTRIVLMNSLSHRWATLPLARRPRYSVCGLMSWDGIQRWTVGRYSFSKLAQLHLLTPLSSLLELVSASASSSSSSSPSRPLLFAVHPGEVLTTFVDRILPKWFFSLPFNLTHWLNHHTCLSPEQGARTGLYALVVDDDEARKSKDGRAQAKTGGVYSYMESMCLYATPSRAARDKALIGECWEVLGRRMQEFLGDVVEGAEVEVELDAVERRARQWEKELLGLLERVRV